MPDGFIPIASDHCGNQICLATKNDKSGKIFFWDHELETEPPKFENVYLVSDSLKKFLNSFIEIESKPNLVIDLVDKGDLEEVKKLLKSGFDINQKGDSIKQTLLQRASLAGKEEIVNYLLKQGADLNFALIYAVTGNKLNIVKLLLQKGADINERDDRNETSVNVGATPLIIAVRHGNMPMIKFLVNKGADIYKTDHQGRNALEYAHYKKNKDEITRILKENSTLQIIGLIPAKKAGKKQTIQKNVKSLVDYARKVFGINLDYSLQSLEQLEIIFKAIFQYNLEHGFDEKKNRKTALKLGCYAGETFIKNLKKGQWVFDPRFDDLGILIGKDLVHLPNEVYKRIKSDGSGEQFLLVYKNFYDRHSQKPINFSLTDPKTKDSTLKTPTQKQMEIIFKNKEVSINEE